MIDFQISDPVINTYVLLLNTSDIVTRYTERQLSRLGITFTQYTVLVTLSACPQPPTLTELGQRLFRTNNGLTTVIDNMERNELVKRVRDKTDRRMIRVIATDKGVEISESVRAPSRELVYRIMSCCKEEDISRLSELLERIRRYTLQELARGNDHNVAIGLTD